jgi:hypothetical protein
VPCALADLVGRTTAWRLRKHEGALVCADGLAHLQLHHLEPFLKEANVPIERGVLACVWAEHRRHLCAHPIHVGAQRRVRRLEPVAMASKQLGMPLSARLTARLTAKMLTSMHRGTMHVMTLAVQLTSTSVQLTSTSVQITSTSVQLTSMSVQLTSTSVQLTSTSVQLTSMSVQLTSTSVQLTSMSVQITSMSLTMVLRAGLAMDLTTAPTVTLTVTFTMTLATTLTMNLTMSLTATPSRRLSRRLARCLPQTCLPGMRLPEPLVAPIHSATLARMPVRRELPIWLAN